MAKKSSRTKRSSRPARQAGGATRRKPGPGAAESIGKGPMNLPLLERLVRLMAENGLTDIQLKDGDQRIILSRAGMGGGMGTPTAGGMMPMMPTAMPSSPSETEAAPTSMAASRPTDTGAAAGLVEIRSPMVGTFYASPSPDARPFVQVGDRVSPDSDVCIIEAMKVFNNIKAETSGTIASIQAESGQAVEYGQVLFLVRPA